MSLTTEIEIAAPLARVWEVLVDVEAWPRWSSTMTSVARIDSGPLAVGSSAKVKQPGFPMATWTVTELAPESVFIWSSRSLGLLTTASHRITSSGAGTRLELQLDLSRAAAPMVRLIFGRQFQRWLETEARAHKTAAESPAA